MIVKNAIEAMEGMMKPETVERVNWEVAEALLDIENTNAAFDAVSFAHEMEASLNSKYGDVIIKAAALITADREKLLRDAADRTCDICPCGKICDRRADGCKYKAAILGREEVK